MHDASIVFFAGLGAMLVILPLPVQWRARNCGTLLLITWLLIGNLTVFVNGIVWWDSIANVAPIWCDISTKLSVGLPIGLTATSLCITRRLVMIASSTTITFSQKQKRLALLIDLSLGILCPILVMLLHYTVQPHRFNIVEGYGCQTATWISTPSIFAVAWWPVILSLTAAGYGAIAIKFFLSRRLQFQTLLRSSKSGLDSRHYVRLMALASVDILIALPFSLWSLCDQASDRAPYESWAVVHYNWSRVDQYLAPQAFSTARSLVSIVIPKWFAPVLSIVFFLFFGVSIDSVGEYGRWIRYIESKLPVQMTKERRPSTFVPKLGSTIAHPAGGEWKEPSTMEASMTDAMHDCEAGHVMQRGTAVGVAVAVRVDREVN